MVWALLTLIMAWDHRDTVDPDGTAYIDLAANAARVSPWYLLSNGVLESCLSCDQRPRLQGGINVGRSGVYVRILR